MVMSACGFCFVMFFSYFLVRNIDTWTVGTAPQYLFLVWKCMIRLRICAHCSLCSIRCFGINMTPMWHDCIFICFIYVMCFLTRKYLVMMETTISDFHTSFYKPFIQKLAFHLPHVRILGTNHCGEMRRIDFKRRELFQYVLCCRDYAERVVTRFANKIQP